jgi:phosphate transport system substrate-binding protein
MRRSASAIATVSALVASVVLVAPASNAAETITSGGSSYANSILTTCAAAYKTDTVTYASSNSGTGRTNFRSGTFDFAAADAPYSATDVKPENFTYVPLVGGPIAIMFNVEGVKSLNLTAKVLGGILNGRYTTWNDDAIQSLNPKAKLPSDKINVLYRSGSSGTTQALANYLRANGASGWKDNGTWATAAGFGSTPPVGSSASNSQTLVEGVKTTKNSIGYADLSDAAAKGIPFAAIRNPLGAYVLPSSKTASTFLGTQKVSANGLINIDYKRAVKGGYNVSLLTYAVAPTAAKNPAKGAAVKKFLTYVINSCSPAKAVGINYSPLSASVKAKALQLVAKVK